MNKFELVYELLICCCFALFSNNVAKCQPTNSEILKVVVNNSFEKFIYSFIHSQILRLITIFYFQNKRILPPF